MRREARHGRDFNWVVGFDNVLRNTETSCQANTFRAEVQIKSRLPWHRCASTDVPENEVLRLLCQVGYQLIMLCRGQPRWPHTNLG